MESLSGSDSAICTQKGRSTFLYIAMHFRVLLHLNWAVWVHFAILWKMFTLISTQI